MTKPLWILVEGVDDEIFFHGVIKPRLEPRFSYIKLWQYSHEPNKRVNDFLVSLQKMNAEYLFVCDINRHGCVTLKKDRITQRYPRVRRENAFVVIREIESWYLAGVDDSLSRKLGLPALPTTDEIDKEKFDQLMPGKFNSRIDYMLEIIKGFSMNTAQTKNKSLQYFTRKNNI